MNILIIKTSALGDVVQALPVVEAIKSMYPDAHIDWVVEKPFAGIVQAHPLIRKTHIIQTKKWRKGLTAKATRQEICQVLKEIRQTSYDYIFDLQGNIKSGVLMALSKGHKKVGCGWKTVHEKVNVLFSNTRINPPPGMNMRAECLNIIEQALGKKAPLKPFFKLNLSSDEQTLANQQLLDNPKKRIMICPGSAWAYKTLREETLIAFIKGLEERTPTQFYWLWGTPDEKALALRLEALFPSSRVIDKLTIPGLQHLMRQMDLIVAMDSFPLHLAGTTGVTTYAVFGPSSAHRYKPLGPQSLAIQGPCPYGRTFERSCPIKRTCATAACIRELPPDDILTSLNKQL